jgi:ubiquitin-protein ligase
MFAAKRLGKVSKLNSRVMSAKTNAFKELTKAKQKLPPGIELVKADDFREWQMDIRVLDDNPLYQDQVYRLSFIFSNQYPIGMDNHQVDLREH